MRLVITPRWGGDAGSDFYPWLRAELGDRFDEIVTATLEPTADAPKITPTVTGLAPLLERDAAHTIALGHSVGCQATLRALARLGAGLKLAGCVLVAPWLAIDEPWDTIEPWIAEPIDDARVRQAVGPIRALLSTDDPFTADHAATSDQLSARFRAGVRVIDGAAHFNRAEEPEVLRAVRALLD